MRKNIFFLPVSLPFFILLLWLPILLLALTALLSWGPEPTLQKTLGLSVIEAVALYVAFLLAGIVNIPLYGFKSPRDSEQKYVSYLGQKYPLPVWHGHETLVSINLGGCVVALLASAYFAAALPPAVTIPAIAIVALGVLLLSRPSRSAGFYVPGIIPPFLSLAVALLGLHLYGVGLYDCARLAIVAGTVGTIAGTTLLNLPRLKRLGTTTVSVGGFGTFDGIILTAVLSTIVACVLA